ncbi:suppressor APC domain-containing protein 2 [Lingula anatina]|uniref:Suppressor APC domain-containing protein 2 n=1 Tax=Lingula anatina TaxID=7574 RepID=A0A1S3HP12_LINAN|nr:suppressor APC domain-containing protein 2 [Lingula anatina]|eukprot:XP_013387793.1 suppressor APC domain-containing protein 2 [Lingula anatina]
MDHQPKSTLDGLPKQFIASLRTLFDILDDDKTGLVRLGEIETRWKEDGIKELPRGVIEALRKVTPPNGLLTFERFVAGLKIALLRNRGDHKDKENQGPLKSQINGPSTNRSNGLTGQRQIFGGQKSHTASQNERTATVRPINNAMQQRALSMPHLADPGKGSNSDMDEPTSAPLGPRNEWFVQSHNQIPEQNRFHHNPALPKDKTGIVATLKSWQRDKMGGTSVVQSEFQGNRPVSTSNLPESRGAVPGAATVNKDGQGRTFEDAMMHKRAVPKKKEPRRHTLANGIDYNMLKRMKQLEQERDVLLQGLEAVDKAREWYHNQLIAVQEKQKYLGKSTAQSDYSLEANQERMNFQMARIYEVNQQLKALIDSSEKGFPLHMNLAVGDRLPRTTSTSSEQEQHVTQMVKAQNRMLTTEISQKSDRITQLEREKASLIRELFEARSKGAKNVNSEDTTFM